MANRGEFAVRAGKTKQRQGVRGELPAQYQYQFVNPGRVRIRTRFAEQEKFVDVSGEVWKHEHLFNMDWRRLEVPALLKDILKGFIRNKLETVSPKTAGALWYGLLTIGEYYEQNSYPWTKDAALRLASTIIGSKQPVKARTGFLVFRQFYGWAVDQAAPGFNSKTVKKLYDLDPPRINAYAGVKNGEMYLDDAEEVLLLKAFKDEIPSETNDDTRTLRNLVMTYLIWEHGCRPETVRAIERKDFHVTEVDGQIYYDIDLLRVKQRTHGNEYIRRRLTPTLGNAIQQLLRQNERVWGDSKSTDPLFHSTWKNRKQERVDSAEVTWNVTDFMENVVGLEDGSPSLLRHNVAQKLANLGYEAEYIAEILDHSNTRSVKHYIAATPDIGRIKTKALGRNQTYIDIMDAMMTGKIISRDDVQEKGRIVQGVVSMHYIGNIGACGLDLDTPCALNPIYSCYTCRKFNPFKDGNHDEVVQALLEESQLYVNMGDLKGNRVVVQLEQTIEAAEFVAKKCKEASGEDA